MNVIGLTGGIGSGKSTVSAYLKEKGCVIIDADKIARRVTEQGSPILDQLAAAFGQDILFSDGTLNRKKLGHIVFADPQKKALLDQITLGAVCGKIREELERVRKAAERGEKNDGKDGEKSADEIVILDVPLLFETGLDELADSVWVVDAEDETRIQRICERDQMSREDAENRIASQMSREERCRNAGNVIDNSGDLDHLYEQIERLIGESK